MSEPIEAVWTGPFDAQTPGGTLQPGDTAFVSEGDLLSDHWQAVKKPARKTTTDPAPATADTTSGGDS